MEQTTNNNIETRSWLQDVELRTNEEGKEIIAGYAIVFNQDSEDLGGFIERIEPNSVNNVNFSDTVATFNHDNNIVLGRVSRNMTYRIDDHGVYVEIDPPNTTAGKDTTELVRSGLVKGMSFTFRTAKGGDKWEKPQGERNVYTRTITQFDMIPEWGPVLFPAYRSTDVSVAKRTLGVMKDVEERELSEALQREKELKQIKINNQHRRLEQRLRLLTKNSK